MASLTLPRLLSDGCVLQRRKSIHIWGWDTPGVTVTASLEKDSASAQCSDKGRFDIYLPAREGGGPYELKVSDSEGESVTVKDVMLGLVWLCTGQSNMEFPIARVKDKYPELANIEDNKRIRTFKIIEEGCFSGPYEEHNTGSWVSVSKDTIMDFSAVAFFFAEKIQSITGQAVGLINSSLGGTRIQTWMSREMLEGYDELIAETEKYNDDKFRQAQADYNIEKTEKWINDLHAIDPGIKENWQKEDLDDSNWDELEIPTMFTGTPLEGLVGCVWFRMKFDLPKSLAGKEARLFLGTMVDSDITYLNGVKVGETEYQYPPRKYDIPKGLTREKGNVLAVRLQIELGLGRITPNKEYRIFNDETSVSLEGKWKYKVGATCDKMPPTDFYNWNASALYNGMTAPCTNLPIDGVIWYQGESNVALPQDYADLTDRMIKGYRKLWGEDNLPFIATQLPNFVIDLTEEENWGEFRIKQNRILMNPSTGLAVTMGLGEDNDLHPVTKKPVGERLALWAAHLKYGYSGEYTGPLAVSATGFKSEDGSPAICVEVEHGDGLTVSDEGKGTQIKDFFVADEAGNRYETSAEIKEGNIIVRCKGDVKNASKLLWCCENTYRGGLIVNSTGIPMCPFEMPITEREYCRLPSCRAF